MQQLSKIFGYATKPITLTIIENKYDIKSKSNKRKKLFINYHTDIKLRKDEIIFTDKKILEIKIDFCQNIEINEKVLTFIIFINEHEKLTTTEFIGFNEYIIKFSNMEDEEIINIFKPQFEGIINLSEFDYKDNLFKEKEKEINLKLFSFKDIRTIKKIPEKYKLPDFYTSNYIFINKKKEKELIKEINKYDGSLQFFLDKQNLYFIYILKDNKTKRLEFNKTLDFIAFSTTYINSLGDGFFSPLESEDFNIDTTSNEDSTKSNEEERINLEINNEIMKSFITNLKLSDSPNKLLTNKNNNFLISDGKNLGVFRSKFDEPEIKELKTSKLGKDITKMQFNNSQLFYIDNQSLKSYDLEKQEIINSESKGVKDIFENTIDSNDNLRGITKDKIFQVDIRNKDMLIPLRTYRTPVNFECANLNGEISAIGSENGDIRIYKGFEKRALVHLNGYGEKCIGISVWGNFIAATYKNYIILIFGKPNKNQKDKKPEFGYPLIRKGLIGIKKLSLSLEHTLKFKMSNKEFKPAVFVEGKKVISSVDNYLISWQLNLNEGVDLNSSIEDIKYNLGKFSDQIISDKIVNNQVFVLFKDKIQVNPLDILNMTFD